MNIIPELATDKNLDILDLIAREELSIRSIAERLDCSPAKVHQAVALFKRHGMVTTERKKNTLLVKPNRGNPLYRGVKSLINISSILDSEAYRKLAKEGSIGVYGSFAQGTDDQHSDVDLLIVTERKQLELAGHIIRLTEDLRREVHPVVMTPEKLRILEQKDYEFYIRLKLTMIQLNGGQIGPEAVF